MGTNASNIKWQTVGSIRDDNGLINSTTNTLAVCGDEDSGKIKITYFERIGENSEISRVKYYGSDNWGDSWNSGVIKEYTSAEIARLEGISMDVQKDNFTCAWGVHFGNGKLLNKNISVSYNDTAHTSWTKPINISYPFSPTPMGIWAPQVFYNHTNDNDTLYIAYNAAAEDTSTSSISTCVVRYKHGTDDLEDIPDTFTDPLSVWEFDPAFSDPEYSGDSDRNTPAVYINKDYSSDQFYFIDSTAYEYDLLLQNNTWGYPSPLSDSTKDHFKPEINRDIFSIYINKTPKFYSGFVLSDVGLRTSGILDCELSLSIKNASGTTVAYKTVNHPFNGKGFDNRSRYAQAFHFSLTIWDFWPGGSAENNSLIVYVDPTPATLTYCTSNNKISPFSSLGINDQFTLNVTSDKPGEARFKLTSNSTYEGRYNITGNTYRIEDPSITGVGLDKYLAYAKKEGNIYRIMFSRSNDGGFTWQEPREIKAFSFQPLVYNEFSRLMIKAAQTNIYIWLLDKSGSTQYLFSSSDAGETFIELEGAQPVQATSEDLACWKMDKLGIGNDYLIKKSEDYGLTWNDFSEITFLGYIYAILEDCTYDPISGNYTFLFTESNIKNLSVATFYNNGSNYIFNSSAIIINGYSASNNDGFPGMTHIDTLIINDTYSETILTSSAKNAPNEGASILAYTTSSKGLNFGKWHNFSKILGEDIYVETDCYGQYAWDVHFTDEGHPCVITGSELFYEKPSFFSFQLSSIAQSNIISTITETLGMNYEAQIDFKGLASNGDIIEDGTYEWTLDLVDRAGFSTSRDGTLIIDNSNPELIEMDNYTTPRNVFPSDEVKITISVKEHNPNNAKLYYRIPGGEWNAIEMDLDDSNSPNINFTANIPAQDKDVIIVYWKVLVEDDCGNTLLIDNDGQLYSYERGVFEYVEETNNLDPTLYDDWTWTYAFTSGADHIVQVWMNVYYDDKFYQKIIINPSGEANATYSIDIDHNLDYLEAKYVFQYETDEGSIIDIETITLQRPTILLIEGQEPPSIIDLGEQKNFTINFNVPEYNQYVDYVYIEYSFDDGLGVKKANLTHSSPVYKHIFTNFSTKATLLNYTVKGVDVYGNEFFFGKNRTIALIPALPSWEMTTELQSMTIIISLIVGAMCGLSYSVIMRKKKTKDRMPEAFGLYQSQVSGTMNETKSEDVKQIQKKGESSDSKELSLLGGNFKKAISLFLALLGLIACIIGAFTMLLLLNSPEFTMLFFAGAMLTAIMLWVLLSAHSVEKAFRAQSQTSLFKDQLLLSILAAVIYMMILGIFFTGNLIPWWRVRLNQTSYNFGPITIPRALTTLSTTFFSSIFLLTWSTFKEISKRVKELKEAESFNENPLNIIERREDAISSTINNVGKKGILFVVIIAVTIIFASDLSVYAPQGVSMLLPFVIGAIGVLLVISFLKRDDTISNKKVVLDNIINCSHCGKETPLGGNFCEHCGEKLLAGKRFSDGVGCPSCSWINTSGSSHCRYCGAKIEGLRSKSASKGKKRKARKTESKKLKHDPNL